MVIWGMGYFDLLLLTLPECLVTGTALVVLLVDLVEMRGQRTRSRRLLAAALTTLGCLAAMVWIGLTPETARTPDGFWVVDPLNGLVKQGLLVLTVGTGLISAESDFTEHGGEYFALLLLASVGMMLLVSTEHLLLLFVALELLSLCLYVMTAFHKQHPHSAEAALKYFLFGGVAAAVMLFGLSLLYGLTGALTLPDLAQRLRGPALDPLLGVALVMVLAGLGFKVAAVPFHLWAPDTYQGAPTPTAAFIASGSKVASFFVLAKVLMLGFAQVPGSAAWRQFAQGWFPLLAVLAVLSMLLGNLAALAQRSVRRLLAYSAIAHAGYALLALLAEREQGMAALLFYVFTYALTVLGAFAVVALVQAAEGGDQLATFAGLRRRSPLLALCMLVFLLSLAGIPPLAGFFGKFYVFTSAAAAGARDLGLLWLVILGVALSTVSLYYYLQVLKQIYVAEAPAEAPPLAISPLSRTVVGLLAMAVVVLGCLPELLLGNLRAAMAAAGF